MLRIAKVKIEDVSRENVFLDEVPLANFDDGSKGFYLLDDKHKVRIWVRIYEKEKKGRVSKNSD